MKFKITTLYLTLFLLVVTQLANAADLIVRDGGAGGAYATITDAINAAVDGDRIIIRPKTGGIPYQENLTIDKSLTFASEIHGTKYSIFGSISIAPTVGMLVNIHFADVVSNNNITVANAVTGGRATVNIANCIIDGNLDLDVNGVTANVYKSVFEIGEFVHGKFIANDCDFIRLNNDSAATLATDDVYIIANNVGSSIFDPAVVNLNSLAYAYNIFNNIITGQLDVDLAKTNSTNFIQNNFIRTNGNNNCVRIDVSTASTIQVVNNIILGSTGFTHVSINSAPFVIVTNNMTSVELNVSSLADIDQDNSEFATFNTTTFTGDNENAGNPDAIYTDTDLTQNDIGPKGGSYNWDNYWTADDTAPLVFFLKTPRRIFNGTTTFSVNGSANSN